MSSGELLSWVSSSGRADCKLRRTDSTLPRTSRLVPESAFHFSIRSLPRSASMFCDVCRNCARILFTSVADAYATEVNNILAQLRQTSQNIDADLGKLRIEKWKADSGTKRDVLGNVESVRRNLQSALPELITQL